MAWLEEKKLEVCDSSFAVRRHKRTFMEEKISQEEASSAQKEQKAPKYGLSLRAQFLDPLGGLLQQSGQNRTQRSSAPYPAINEPRKAKKQSGRRTSQPKHTSEVAFRGPWTMVST
jgi:hypothetical protein